MELVVCVKQVPDPDAGPYRLDPATRRLVREGAPNILDPADAVALEEALRLAERTPASRVTVVSMGPPAAEEAVRRALAMGAGAGVLITDPGLAGSDALGTARALAAALARQGFDLIVCATESTDGSTGMVPGMVAELLGVPHLAFIRQLELAGRELTVQRATERGYQVLRCLLPALVTIASGINEPRYPPLKGIMAARRKPVEKLSLVDLGLTPASVGQTGARERVLELRPVEGRAAGEITNAEDGVARAVALLEQRGLV